jgi:hypothetical protein
MSKYSRGYMSLQTFVDTVDANTRERVDIVALEAIYNDSNMMGINPARYSRNVLNSFRVFNSAEDVLEYYGITIDKVKKHRHVIPFAYGYGEGTGYVVAR